MSELVQNQHEDHGPSRRAMLAGLGGLAAGAFMARSAQAGPLDPPPGPIAPTPGPEPRIPLTQQTTPGDATSVFRITSPGSYFLTKNLTGLVGKHGITVVASGVTIDLNGFLLRGTGAAHGDYDGVNLEGLQSRIVLQNGHVEAMGRVGVSLDVDACVVQGVTVSQCLGTGIRASGRVIGCSVMENAGSGISVGGPAVVRYCVSIGNGGHGILVPRDCVVEGCAARTNGQDGIRTAAGTVIRACVAERNSGDGISLASGSAFDCAVWLSGGNGIAAEDGSTVTNCRSSINEGFGILTSSGGVVSGCAASENSPGGISAVSDAHLLRNTCDGNGGAGILISGSDNRIEGNHCTDNPIGLLVDSGGNIIMRNTCAGNTILNWSLSANNYHGPIINRSGVGTPAVSGNSAAGTLASIDPHANFTF